MVYVAFNCHLVIGMCIMINHEADFDANRANIAAAVNNLIYTWKQLAQCYMMTSSM